MSLIGKSINEVIQTIFLTIQSKRHIITSIKSEYLSSHNDNNNFTIMIPMNKYKLIDLLDEFEITISQSLQGIQTLQTEICNLQEAQRDSSIPIRAQLHRHDNQTGLSPIILPNLNDDLLFDSIQTNNQVNNSIVETVSNITNMSQIYHKPKASKASHYNNSNLSSRLKFDYDILNNYTTSIQNSNNSNQQQIMNNLLISYSEINGEPIEQDKSRLPIRQSIRANLTKQVLMNKDNERNTLHDDTLSKTEEKISMINQEKEKKDQCLLSRISQKETYKIYFADKYGNGQYEEFVRQCNKKLIDLNEIQKEFEIIENISKVEGRSNNILQYHNQSTNNVKNIRSNPLNSSTNKNNNGNKVNKTNNSFFIESSSFNCKIEAPPKYQRKYSLNKTEASSTLKSACTQKTPKEINQSNPFIEPIHFCQNYLRQNTPKSQRSSRKPNEIKQITKTKTHFIKI